MILPHVPYWAQIDTAERAEGERERGRDREEGRGERERERQLLEATGGLSRLLEAILLKKGALAIVSVFIFLLLGLFFFFFHAIFG